MYAHQGRRQKFSLEGPSHGEREPITGVWGQSPQRGPGADPLVGSGGKAPLKLKALQTLTSKRGSKSAQFLRFGNLSVISVLFN